jgi:hypothetical protein
VKIQNVSPLGDLEVPILRRIVKAGEVVDVPDGVGEQLVLQAGTWALEPTVKSKSKTIAADAADPKE